MDTNPRPPGQGRLEDEPEVAFTREWGALVRRARADAGLSQRDLAIEIGASQPQIAQVETFSISSSKLVMPLVRFLKVPPPSQYFEDELDQRWVESGRVLRRTNEAGFRGLLAAAEQMIAGAEPKEH